MKRTLISAVALLALVAGCASVDELPEEERLTTLRNNLPDYSAFDRRARSDATSARGIDGVDSVEVAKLEISEGWTVLEDPRLENAMLVLYDELLPEDFDTGVPRGPIRFDANTAGLGAKALNTGTLVFQAGVLFEPKHYDEINFVLAHEMSHILLDHFRSDELNEKITAGFGAAMIAQGRNPYNRDHYIPVDANGRLDTAALATIGAKAIANAVYERRKVVQEIEADQLALELLVKQEQYNSHLGGLAFLRLLEDAMSDAVTAEEAAIERNRKALIAQCGERAGEGKGFLGDLLATAEALATTKLEPECEAFQKGQLPSEADLIEAETKLETITRRIGLLERYWEEKLKGDATAFPSMTRIKNEQGDPTSYAMAISPMGDVVRLSEVAEVERLTKQGRCTEAQAVAKRALRSKNDLFPPLRYAYYEAEKACDVEDAGRHLLMVGKAKQGTAARQYEAYEYYKETGDLEKAFEALGYAAKLDPAPDKFLSVRIETARLLGRFEEADQLYVECQGVDRSILAQCKAALLTEPKGADEPDTAGEDMASYQSRANTVASLRYSVIAAAMADPAFSSLLPRDGEYSFFIPTDDALATYVGGDPKQLLKPANHETLKEIIRTHIVQEPDQDLSIQVGSQRSSLGFETVPSVAAESYSKFEEFLFEEKAAVVPLSFKARAGRAFLTDVVDAGGRR